MSYIVSKSKLLEQLPKVLSSVTSLYKKHPEAYHVSKGLCNVLEASASPSDMLNPHVEMVLQAIFPQVF